MTLERLHVILDNLEFLQVKRYFTYPANAILGEIYKSRDKGFFAYRARARGLCL